MNPTDQPTPTPEPEWPDVIGTNSTAPSEMPEMRLSFKEDAQMNDSIFWINPWSGQEEKVASFFWPTHPPEKTEEVEKIWEAMGHLFANAFETRNQLNVALDSLRRNTAWSDADYKALKSEVQSLKDRDAYRENMIDELKRDRDQWRTSANYLNQQADQFKAELDKANAKIRELSTPAVQGMLSKMASSDMRENLKVLDRVKTERDAAIADREKLREALENAPHTIGCLAKREFNPGIGCTCWKSAALLSTLKP